MTELERLLIGRLEQMEKQTAALELQLQRQELSLSECQREIGRASCRERVSRTV